MAHRAHSGWGRRAGLIAGVLAVVAEDALDDGRWTVHLLELDGDLGLELDTTIDRLGAHQTNPPSNSASHGNRGDESHPIDAIVDHHRNALPIRLHDRCRQRPHQREREEAMSDRAPKRAGLGSGARLVDPLVIEGGIGERIHPILFDLKPLADSEFGVDKGRKVDHRRERSGPATCSYSACSPVFSLL